ncbi:MAG: NAD(P)/FAD-dependent oxidoreductase [Bacteroidales bacterium]|nr:NAD(P)/FAD-dependent oxidoreductase [Bacteroidales bacterium]
MSSDSKYDVVVIGGGLGGLECGYILSKKGKKVLVLEQCGLIGGCIQSFRREGHLFDTGFHYVGGLDEGQMLHRLFKYFGLMELPWVRLDRECFDQVTIGDSSYKFVNGYENFEEELCRAFPSQREGIAKYVKMLKEVGDNIQKSFEPRTALDVLENSMFSRSAYGFLKESISDDRLIDVLSGTSIKMELNREKLPLYTFGQINSTFVQSAYRLRGGGMQIAETLVASIERFGGKVVKNRKVTGFKAVDGRVSSVIVNNGEEEYETDIVISDIHPARTAQMLQESGLVRKIFAKRMTSMENTFGVFTVNIALKPGKLRYRNRNEYIYRKGGIWEYHEKLSDEVEAALVSFAPPKVGREWSEVVDILIPMKWEKVSKWFGTKIGYRGEDYKKFKEEMAERAIDFVNEKVEGLRAAVDKYWVSTPLTYTDYTGTVEGSAYGIRKDYSNTMYTILTPKTPVENVYLTGQNLNLHGILGTSMTSFFTCAEILGMQTIVEDLG